jgi:hypothetical protein
MKGQTHLAAAFALAALVLPGCHKKKEPDAKPVVAATPAKKPSSHEPGLRSEADAAAEQANMPPTVAAELLANDAHFEAWFKKYHLDLNDPKMLDADPDGDGYTNREEFLAGTDPLDPNSHPGVHKDIQLKEYTEVKIPFVLKEVDGETAHIERTDEGGGGKVESLKVGQPLPGSPYRIARVQSKRATDKDGHPYDGSHVTLENPTTKQKVDLVKGMTTRSSASSALLTSPDGSRTITVRQGDTFQWGTGGPSYKVIDLRAEQVILQQEDTKEMWTVKKTP